MSSKNPSKSPSPSTSFSSIASDAEAETLHTSSVPRLTRPTSASLAPVLQATTEALQRISVDHVPPFVSHSDYAEAETSHSKAVADASTCKGCRRWEKELKSLQLQHTSVSDRLSATIADLHMMKKAKEETEAQSRAQKALFEEQTGSLEQRIETLSSRIDSLLKHYQDYRRSAESEFSRLQRERVSAQMEMSEVEEHYRTLLGKRRDAIADMSAPIDLPSAREDLELCALQMREELLSTSVACQHLRNRLDAEKMISRDQLNEERRKRIQTEEVLHKLKREAGERIAELTRAVEAAQQSVAAKQSTERVKDRAVAEIKQLQTDLAEKSEALKLAREEVAQLRSRLAHLQGGLENTEQVSLDFVRLSQHLQVQLERQREQTHEVRWQDPEDVQQCGCCQSPFKAGVVKQNCRHCGVIFCPACLTKVIPPSGARSRPALVCDMCHTLLVKDAAPYFSSGTFPRADEETSATTSPVAPIIRR